MGIIPDKGLPKSALIPLSPKSYLGGKKMLFTAAFTSSLFILWTKTVETFPPLLFSHGNLPVCSTTSSELDLKLS